MLKKFLIGTFVAVAFMVAFGASSASADCSITTTLKVGSKGAEVSCLQTKVGATADGSFGPMTKASVMAYQASHGLSSDGVVGPMSRAVLNGANGAVSGNFPAGCSSASGFSSVTGLACVSVNANTFAPSGCTSASGFSPVTGGACYAAKTTVAGCSAGALFSATTGASCTGATTPTMTGNTDGSITATTSSYVSGTVIAKKGETKDVTAVRLQASVGPVQVSRVDVTFNARPWLLFSAVTLHDGAGRVLATKTLSSIADTTEITVGSSYQVRFDGLNYVVAPGTNPDLVVSVSVLAASDKITGQNVTVAIPSMKTVSEIGYASTITTTATNTVNLTTTGSVAVLYSRISPSSPLTGQQIYSATQATNGVTLGVFSLKTSNNTATVNTLPVTLITGTSTNFSNFRLIVNGTDVAGGVLSSGTVTFSNLTTPLALDTWTDFAIKADIAQNATATSVATSFNVSGITVTDANYGTADITTGAGLRTSSTLTLTTNAVALSGATATLGSAITQNSTTVGYNATYAFTLTNSSTNDLYVSATPLTFMTVAGTGYATALTNLTVTTPSTSVGDTANVSYVIPSGTARTFTFSAALRGATGTSTTIAATAINYGLTSGTPTGASITSGLTALTLTASF